MCVGECFSNFLSKGHFFENTHSGVCVLKGHKTIHRREWTRMKNGEGGASEFSSWKSFWYQSVEIGDVCNKLTTLFPFFFFGLLPIYHPYFSTRNSRHNVHRVTFKRFKYLCRTPLRISLSIVNGLLNSWTKLAFILFFWGRERGREGFFSFVQTKWDLTTWNWFISTHWPGGIVIFLWLFFVFFSMRKKNERKAEIFCVNLLFFVLFSSLVS